MWWLPKAEFKTEKKPAHRRRAVRFKVELRIATYRTFSVWCRHGNLENASSLNVDTHTHKKKEIKSQTHEHKHDYEGSETQTFRLSASSSWKTICRSKQLPIHTVIKIWNFCPKWNTHQEYVARMSISFFFFFSTAKSIVDAASSFKWCLQTLSTLGVKYLARKRQILNWASCITIPG